jgi:short-subunit dehydrogenase involved in D-alanine esterification of teichoic acids
LDILINNAGIMNVMDFAQDDIPLERLENEVATNFLAPLKLTKLLLPTLQKQTNGAIVNVSSGVAYLPMPASPVYSATKAALHSFTKSLRYSLRQSNITVFEAIPPVVDTAMPMQLKGEGKSAKKMSAEETARLIIQGMENGTEEIRIGDNKLLYWASRFAPTLAETELNKL